MKEKSFLPVGIKTPFLIRPARSLDSIRLPNGYPTSVSHMTNDCSIGTVPVIVGDKTDTRVLKSVNLTNFQFVSAFKCI
jgi:hypothetical protein